MKFNKFFMVLAAAAFVACSSEDLSDFGANQAIEEDSRLVQLDPNFALAGVGVEDNGTRTHWEQDAVSGALVNKFLPIFNATAAAGNILYNKTTNVSSADLTAQAVGLCWLGQVPGEKVYTNYQFYHFGWLAKGETEADYACGTLYNGALYSDITLAAATNGAGGEAIPGTDWTAAGLPAQALKAGVDNLNYNSGIYKTDNKAIFGGQYIVYYPFNPDFKEAGTIPAKAETKFNWDITAVPANAWEAPELGKATFRYSAPVTIDGGDEAANFGMYNLSTLVRLRVACPASDANIGDYIDQVVLYSPSKKLLKQANLAADKIIAGKKGAELYDGTEEGIQTITTNFTSATTTLNVKANTKVSAYLTVLPTTVDDLVALVHNSTDGTWARVAIPTTEFKAGGATVLDITAAAADFKTEFIAVDDASLRTALTNANAAAATNPVTITLIGDIELATNLNIDQATYANIKNVTITDGAIIVPEGTTLTLKSFTMKSDIRVLGTSCCSGLGAGGALVVDVEGTNKTVINNVTMVPSEARVKVNPTVTYSGAATVAEGAVFDAQAGTVDVNAAVQHKGNINIAEDVTLTVKAGGDLNFMGSTVVNDGTIEVKKSGKFDMTAADGGATATDGQRMTNNGKFIHNVDAGVGTAVQKMTQNGEYRCRVDDQVKLDDAFLQWKACSVIEIVNAGTTYNLGTAKGITPAAYKHNGKFIDIEVNTTSTTTFNNPVVGATTDGDNETIQIGSLTVEGGGLYVDFVTGKGQRTLEVNGDMAVKAAQSRLVSSKKIDVKGNLTVDGTGTKLQYRGKKANGGFAVAKDITVSDNATFDAGGGLLYVDALNITCANFYLKSGATAIFGNRTDGAATNLTVTGTISNPAGCTFDIVAANQDLNGSVLAWVTCSKLEVGGTWTAARPRVE